MKPYNEVCIKNGVAKWNRIDVLFAEGKSGANKKSSKVAICLLVVNTLIISVSLTKTCRPYMMVMRQKRELWI